MLIGWEYTMQSIVGLPSVDSLSAGLNTCETGELHRCRVTDSPPTCFKSQSLGTLWVCSLLAEF